MMSNMLVVVVNRKEGQGKRSIDRHNVCPRAKKDLCSRRVLPATCLLPATNIDCLNSDTNVIKI